MGRNDERDSRYRPSWDTDVMATLKKHGFKRTTARERVKKPTTDNVRYLTKPAKSTT